MPPAPPEYLRSAGISALVAQLLYNRKIASDQINSFLFDSQQFQNDPFLLPDIHLAVNRIHRALSNKEKIAVYGDFDADGVTATAIVVEGLNALGSEAIPYIPHRLHEGYGLNMTAIKNLWEEGVRLIITVDCGISAIKEVNEAKELGMDIIITDHHTPASDLPQAIAVIDPKRSDSQYPFPHLAGAGIAFKLVQALLHKDKNADVTNKLLDLVALGTIPDMVPLTGENRYLVKKGLEALNNTQRIGVKKMIGIATLKPDKISEGDVAWALGPRLNAAGRIGHATNSYRLLTTVSGEEAVLLAKELEEGNEERQALTRKATDMAEKRLAGKSGQVLLIDGDESYPPGVIGLVAGKLAAKYYRPTIILTLEPEICRGSARSIPEFNIVTALQQCQDLLINCGGHPMAAKYYRPTIILTLEPEICRGSARSIPEFNIVTALQQCQDLLINCGGHPMAAGFMVTRENLSQVKRRLTDMAVSQLAHLDLMPRLIIDAEIPLTCFAGETLNLIRQMAPFGQGNPSPTFLSRGVEVLKQRSIGKQGNHLELEIKQGGTIWRAIAFNYGNNGRSQENDLGKVELPRQIDIVYNLKVSQWRGEEVLSLSLCAFAPSVQKKNSR